MHSWSAPLPEEPVGEGARWVAQYPMNMGGISSGQQKYYTLQKLEPGSAILATTFENWTPPQDIDTPGVPAGTKLRIEHLRMTGKGTQRIYFKGLAVEGKSETDADMKMSAITGGRSQKMTIKMAVKVNMGGKIAPQPADAA